MSHLTVQAQPISSFLYFKPSKKRGSLGTIKELNFCARYSLPVPLPPILRKFGMTTIYLKFSDLPQHPVYPAPYGIPPCGIVTFGPLNLRPPILYVAAPAWGELSPLESMVTYRLKRFLYVQTSTRMKDGACNP